VQPVYPQVVYVPYYDPFVVYGAWWWPAYRPVVFRPWPVFAVNVSFGYFPARFNWHARQVVVVNNTFRSWPGRAVPHNIHARGGGSAPHRAPTHGRSGPAQPPTQHGGTPGQRPRADYRAPPTHADSRVPQAQRQPVPSHADYRMPQRSSQPPVRS